MDKVEAYFEQSFANNTNLAGRPAPRDRINRTLLPPIYLQQPGHSLTIVGLEKHVNGQRFVIVLDPMYLTSRAMNQLLDVGPRRVRSARPEVMDIYRRGDERLYKHTDFEILMCVFKKAFGLQKIVLTRFRLGSQRRLLSSLLGM